MLTPAKILLASGLVLASLLGVEPIKILFLAANPKETTALSLDEECREVSYRIHMAKHRDHMKLVSRWAARGEDLIQALREEEPQVIHFSGREASTGLVLEDPQGNVQPITPEALLAIFQAIPTKPRLAVFNARDSLPLATAAIEVLEAAIGLEHPVEGGLAITYAAALYGTLAFGRRLLDGHDLAVAQLRHDHIPVKPQPNLLVRPGQDPKTWRLVDPLHTTPPPAPGTLALWRERFSMLLEAEALEADYGRRAQLSQHVEEARRKIQEFGEGTPHPPY